MSEIFPTGNALAMNDPPTLTDEERLTDNLFTGGIAGTRMNYNNYYDDEDEDENIVETYSENDYRNITNNRADERLAPMPSAEKVASWVKHGYFDLIEETAIPAYRRRISQLEMNGEDVETEKDILFHIAEDSRKNMYYKFCHPETMSSEEKRHFNGVRGLGFRRATKLSTKELDRMVDGMYQAYKEAGLLHINQDRDHMLSPDEQKIFDMEMKQHLTNYLMNLQDNGMTVAVRNSYDMLFKIHDPEKSDSEARAYKKQQEAQQKLVHKWQNDPFMVRENASDRIIKRIRGNQVQTQVEETKSKPVEVKEETPESVPKEATVEPVGNKENKENEKVSDLKEKPKNTEKVTQKEKEPELPTYMEQPDISEYADHYPDEYDDGGLPDFDDFHPQSQKEKQAKNLANYGSEQTMQGKYSPNEKVIHENENGEKVEDTVVATTKNISGNEVIHTESGQSFSENDNKIEPKVAESAPEVKKEGEELSEEEKYQRGLEEFEKQYKAYSDAFEKATSIVGTCNNIQREMKQYKYDASISMHDNAVKIFNKAKCEVEDVNKDYSIDREEFKLKDIESGERFTYVLDKVQRTNDPMVTIRRCFGDSVKKCRENQEAASKKAKETENNKIAYKAAHSPQTQTSSQKNSSMKMM